MQTAAGAPFFFAGRDERRYRHFSAFSFPVTAVRISKGAAAVFSAAAPKLMRRAGFEPAGPGFLARYVFRSITCACSARRGIRTPRTRSLKPVCLPFHHPRVWRSESDSNAQARCRAASLAGRCLTFRQPLRVRIYDPCGDRTRIAALKGRCPDLFRRRDPAPDRLGDACPDDDRVHGGAEYRGQYHQIVQCG